MSMMKAGRRVKQTPKELGIDTLAKKARRTMKAADVTPTDLLKDLEKQRARYNRERYGRKQG